MSSSSKGRRKRRKKTKIIVVIINDVFPTSTATTHSVVLNNNNSEAGRKLMNLLKRKVRKEKKYATSICENPEYVIATTKPTITEDHVIHYLPFFLILHIIPFFCFGYVKKASKKIKFIKK